MRPVHPDGGEEVSVDARRDQLLRAGVELLKTKTPDEISVGAVTRQAGISRGLLYPYFEDKDAFVVAVMEQAGEELRRALRPGPGASGGDPIGAAIDAFITFAEAHAVGFRAVLTGNVANPKVAAVIDQTRERDLAAFVAGIAAITHHPAEAAASDVLRLGLHAHMHFMEGAVVRWLSRGEITRAQLRGLIVGALHGTVAAALAVPSREP